MANKERRPLQERVQRTILAHSIYRWESAVIIALTVLLTTFSLLSKGLNFIPPWTWMGILLFGLVSETILVYLSVHDAETNRLVMDQVLKDEFQISRLYDPALKQQVNRAFDYRDRIEASLRHRRQTMLTENIRETINQIDLWLKNISRLAHRLNDDQEERTLFTKDKAHINKRLGQLQQQLQTASDLKTKEQIQATLAGMQRQLTLIESVESTMERAYLQLEHSVVALGTIHSQVILTNAKDLDGRNATKLRLAITAEVNQLDDMLLAMDEVYAAGTDEEQPVAS